jgi:addiction module RelB/DinJ family antitoxin
MHTILNIKLDKDLKIEAKRLADEMGIPLTTVVNSFLKQFVRERKITLDLDNPVNTILTKEWELASRDAKEGKNVSPAFSDPDKLFKHLGI